MKIYATFPNPKSGLIEEQLIETENYTADELRDIAFYDIFFSIIGNWKLMPIHCLIIDLK